MTAGPRSPRLAVGLLFLANGLTLPALLPRLPQIKDAVGADPALFGLALLGTGAGGLLGSMLASRAVATLGTRRAAATFALVLAIVAVVVGSARSVPVLFVIGAALGVADGIADITQNHLMFEVQRRARRSLTSGMHAMWSVGALLGTAWGTASAATGISVTAQTGLTLVVVAVLLAAAVPALRRLGAVTAPVIPSAHGPGTPATEPPGRRRWVLVVLAGLVVAGVEGTASDWSALALRDGLGASDGLAGAGPTAFTGAMLVGRLLGDRVIDRVGQAAAARAGGALVAVGSGTGLVAAAAVGSPALLVAGLAVAGVGAATLFPAMLASGDRRDPSGRGVAVASAASRVGFLAVPVVVGALGQALGLEVAFGLLPLCGLLVVVVLPRALR